MNIAISLTVYNHKIIPVPCHIYSQSIQFICMFLFSQRTFKAILRFVLEKKYPRELIQSRSIHIVFVVRKKIRPPQSAAWNKKNSQFLVCFLVLLCCGFSFRHQQVRKWLIEIFIAIEYYSWLMWILIEWQTRDCSIDMNDLMVGQYGTMNVQSIRNEISVFWMQMNGKWWLGVQWLMIMTKIDWLCLW